MSQLTLTAAKEYASDCHVLLSSRGTVTDLVMARLAFIGSVGIPTKNTLFEGRHLLFKLVCASVTGVHVLAHPFNVFVRFLDIALEFLA